MKVIKLLLVTLVSLISFDMYAHAEVEEHVTQGQHAHAQGIKAGTPPLGSLPVKSALKSTSSPILVTHQHGDAIDDLEKDDFEGAGINMGKNIENVKPTDADKLNSHTQTASRVQFKDQQIKVNVEDPSAMNDLLILNKSVKVKSEDPSAMNDLLDLNQTQEEHSQSEKTFMQKAFDFFASIPKSIQETYNNLISSWSKQTSKQTQEIESKVEKLNQDIQDPDNWDALSRIAYDAAARKDSRVTGADFNAETLKSDTKQAVADLSELQKITETENNAEAKKDAIALVVKDIANIKESSRLLNSSSGVGGIDSDINGMILSLPEDIQTGLDELVVVPKQPAGKAPMPTKAQKFGSLDDFNKLKAESSLQPTDLSDKDFDVDNFEDNNHAQAHSTAAIDTPVTKLEALTPDATQVVESDDGRSDLHRAIDAGDNEAISKLITSGANLNAKDSEGLTPLHYAVADGNTQVATALLSAGADSNIKTNAGATPLHYAVSSENEENSDIVRSLIKNRAQVNEKDGNGYTAFDHAIGSGKKDSSNLLFKAGAKPKPPVQPAPSMAVTIQQNQNIAQPLTLVKPERPAPPSTPYPGDVSKSATVSQLSLQSQIEQGVKLKSVSVEAPGSPASVADIDKPDFLSQIKTGVTLKPSSDRVVASDSQVAQPATGLKSSLQDGFKNKNLSAGLKVQDEDDDDDKSEIDM